MQGLYGKYKIEKADGSPIDEEAQYFVLRLDTDPYARRAIRRYAVYMDEVNPQLGRELKQWLQETHNTEAGQKEVDLWAKEIEEQGVE